MSNYTDTYVPRWPSGDSPLPLTHSNEIDFNQYELVSDGKHFVHGDAPKAGSWFKLKCQVDGVRQYRRLYTSFTEIGGKNFPHMLGEVDYNLELFTHLFWPEHFYDISIPDLGNENIFEYVTKDNITLISGLTKRPFGIVWGLGAPQLTFDKSIYINLRNKALQNPHLWNVK